MSLINSFLGTNNGSAMGGGMEGGMGGGMRENEETLRGRRERKIKNGAKSSASLREAIHATTRRHNPAYYVCESTYHPSKLNINEMRPHTTLEASLTGEQGEMGTGAQMFFKARDDVSSFQKEACFPLRRQVEMLLLKRGGVKKFGRVESQVAVYRGGSSGYVKHCDCSEGCGGGGSSKGEKGGNKRCITVIFYLGGIAKDGTCLREWKEEYGGHLELFGGEEEESRASVVPAAGTLLFFRSDVVPHLVSAVSEGLNGLEGRGAITFWFWDVELESSAAGDELESSASQQQEWDDETASILCVKCLPRVPPLPWSLGSGSGSEATTFVNIGSKNDPELPLTLLNIFLTHTNPDKLFVGICLQNDKDMPAQLQTLLPERWLNENVRVLEVPPAHTTGPLFARSLASTLWRGEDFFLQMDSHMR
jgi:hypothetical protein